jgi:hypothetical protein
MDSVSQEQNQYILLTRITRAWIAAEAVLMQRVWLSGKMDDFIEYIAFQLRALSAWLRS